MEYTKEEQSIAVEEIDALTFKSYHTLWHLSFQLISDYLQSYGAPYDLLKILTDLGANTDYMDVMIAETTPQATTYLLESYMTEFLEPSGPYYSSLTYQPDPKANKYWYLQIDSKTNKTYLVDMYHNPQKTLPDIYSLNAPSSDLEKWYVKLLRNMMTYPSAGNLLPPQKPLSLESPANIKKKWAQVKCVWNNIWEINPMARSVYNGQSYLLINDLIDTLLKVNDESIREVGTKMLLDVSLSTKMVHPVTSPKYNRISVPKVIKAVGMDVAKHFICNVVNGGVLCYHIVLDFENAYDLLPSMVYIIDRYMQLNIYALKLASKDFLDALYDSHYELREEDEDEES